MNILYLSQVYSSKPTHAAAVTTYEIVKRLAERGHKVTVLVPNFDHDGSLKLVTNQLRICDNIDVVAFTSSSDDLLQKNLLSYGLTCTALYAPLIAKVSKRTDFDVIISMYHPSHLATFSAHVLSRFLKIPWVVKVHDLLPDLTDPSVLRRTYKKVMFRLSSAFLKKADFVLVPSTEWVDLAARVYDVDVRKIVLFPTGVDLRMFNPKVKNDSIRETLGLKNKKVLLFIGMLSRDRGLDHLILAMPKVLEKAPEVRCLVIGKGPEKSRLLNLSRRLEVDKFIFFLDEVNHDLIPKYISLADVAIGPLTKLDITVGTFPIKVLEYLACGKPVVACRGSVSKDLVVNGYNGVLADTADVDELSEVIVNLINGGKFAKKLGENARNHVENLYDWNNVIGILEETLDNACSK